MGVLPALSAHCMPRACQALMSDPSSPIIDFYPETFKLDMNGKKFAWQAVCLLPWIDEKRLLRELAAYEHTFDDEERYRNAEGMDYLFVMTGHPVGNTLAYFYLGDTVEVNWTELTKCGETHMMHGFVRGYPSAFVPGTYTRYILDPFC
jgi:5'-3' exonuclease